MAVVSATPPSMANNVFLEFMVAWFMGSLKWAARRAARSDKLPSLDQSEDDDNNGYDQQEMYESPGAVADKANEPADDQDNGDVV